MDISANNPNAAALAIDGDMMDAGYEPRAGAFQIDFRALYTILRRNLALFVGVIVLAVALGLVVTLLTTPTYVATSSVQIDQQADQILSGDQGVEPTIAYQDADRYLQTETDVLRSRSMAADVATKLNLYTPAFFHAMNAPLPTPTHGWSEQKTLQDGALTLIQDSLTVTLPVDSRVVKIAFGSPDPQLAANIANGYATGFIEANLQRKYDSSAYAREFLSKQLVDAQAKLEQAEMQLNLYGRQAGLIDTSRAAVSNGGTTGSSGGSSGGSSITAASLVQLNEAANQAKADRIAAEERWHTAAATPLMSLRDVLQNPAIQQLQQQLAEAQAKLQEEQTHHQDQFPSVVEAKSYVESLQQQIQALAGTVLKSIEDQYHSAVQQERALDTQVNALKGATLSEQDRSVRYNILARDVDTDRTLYDGLLERYKELSATAGATTNNISVVDQAEAPMTPSSPKLLLNLALSLLAGVAIAVGLVFAREQLDDRVRTPADVERKLGVPILGSIPQPEDKDTMAEALASPRSPVAEAYYALRTSLLYSTAHGLPRSLLVTSSQSGEGKSTTSLALATDLARLGRSTLLVDTDLRRPTLHRTLGRSNTLGLSTLLTGQNEDVVEPTDVPNLHFVPSGPIPPNPTELLGNSQLIDIVRRFETQYDVVVLDGPPVLGLADAPMLAAVADGTLFVVEADRGHYGGAKAALRRLRLAHTQLVGAVLTKFNPHAAGLAKEYGYDYYRYGPEDDQ